MTDQIVTDAGEREKTVGFVKTGEDYLESLRDGRSVYYRGKEIDVTSHPATAGGVHAIARLYDHQHDPRYRDILTYERPEDGQRVTTAFLVPRTKEDLRRRRAAIEHISRETFGFFGRGIDMIAIVQVGMCGVYSKFNRLCPEFADNLLSYRLYAEENNLHLAEVVAEPQGVRGRNAGTPPNTPLPDRAVAKVTRQNSEGIWISGVKAVATAAAQANEVLIGRVYPTKNEDECFWCSVPSSAPGVRIFCREGTADPGDAQHHPVTGFGEEMDGLIAFDDVFVPRSHVFSVKVKDLHDTNLFNEFARHEHWYTLTRIVVRAEMYAALGRIMCEALDLVEIPAVRQRIANLFQQAQILRGMIVASEEMAELGPDGVMTPDANMVTAGRAYALETLTETYSVLQDLAGQGLMTRMSDEDLDVECAFGKKLSWFLDQKSITAQEKSRVMNLVWDVACSGTAVRAKLFEVANAQNLPFLKERLFREYDTEKMAQYLRDLAGIGVPMSSSDIEYSIRWDWTSRART